MCVCVFFKIFFLLKQIGFVNMPLKKFRVDSQAKPLSLRCLMVQQKLCKTDNQLQHLQDKAVNFKLL